MKKIIVSMTLMLSCSAFAASQDDGALFSCEGKNLVVEALDVDLNNENTGIGEQTLRVWYHDFMINDSAATTRQESGAVIFQTVSENPGSMAGMALSIDQKTLKGDFVAIALDGSTIQRKVTCIKL